MISALAFVSAARSLVGLPYVHQGRSRHGLDCIGLVWTAAALAGLDLDAQLARDGQPPMTWNYGRAPDARLLARLAAWARALEAPVPGCIAFIRFFGSPDPAHFGIHTGASIVHANSLHRFVREHAYRPPWTSWTHSLWALPGVEYAGLAAVSRV